MLAAEISTESLDTANLQPMIETACASSHAAGVTERPGSCWPTPATGRTTRSKRSSARASRRSSRPTPTAAKNRGPGRRGGLYDFARRVLATDWGKQLYLRRQGIVEPVFGQIKTNRGADRFLRRGRSAVRSEWRLLTATHNLLKLTPQHRRGNRLTAAATPLHRPNRRANPPPPARRDPLRDGHHGKRERTWRAAGSSCAGRMQQPRLRRRWHETGALTDVTRRHGRSWLRPASGGSTAACAASGLGSPELRSRWTRLSSSARSRVCRPENRAQRVAVAPSSAAFACTTWRSTLAGKKRTTFAKLNREQKVREKRQERSLRKEQRRCEGDAGGEMQQQVEDLSHLDVAVVQGVEPDVTVKR